MLPGDRNGAVVDMFLFLTVARVVRLLLPHGSLIKLGDSLAEHALITIRPGPADDRMH